MREAISKAALGSAILTAESGEQSFCFEESFLGFAGHFPDFPVLPAILQTLLAQVLTEQLIGESLQFVALERAKFTRQLRPGDRICVSLNCLQKEGHLRCKTQLRVGNESAATFTLILDKGDSV